MRDLGVYEIFLSERQRERIAGMRSPVRCGRCGQIYDVGHVEVTARYADCSVWKAPCCGATVDDRPGWGGRSSDVIALSGGKR